MALRSICSMAARAAGWSEVGRELMCARMSTDLGMLRTVRISTNMYDWGSLDVLVTEYGFWG